MVINTQAVYQGVFLGSTAIGGREENMTGHREKPNCNADLTKTSVNFMWSYEIEMAQGILGYWITNTGSPSQGKPPRCQPYF